MFPIGDENHGARGWARATLLLVGINAAVFAAEALMNGAQLRAFITTYGAIPAELARGADLFAVFTAMFIHGGLTHVAGNLLFLAIFGDNVERRFGSALFVLFYLACGLAATLAHVLANPESPLPTVGASGAISGVLGAYLVLYPFNRVRVVVGLWGLWSVPAFLFLGLWFVMQLWSGAATLGVETAQSAGVAYWSHVGGFAAGAAGALILAPFRKEPAAYVAEFALWRDRE